MGRKGLRRQVSILLVNNDISPQWRLLTRSILCFLGGGSYKYSTLIQEKLGLTLEKEDEISCLIKGANFLLKNVPDEAFGFERKQNPEYRKNLGKSVNTEL